MFVPFLGGIFSPQSKSAPIFLRQVLDKEVSHIQNQNAPKERRRRRAGKQLSKRCFWESVFSSLPP